VSVAMLGADAVVALGSGQPGNPARLHAYRLATGTTAWTVRLPTLVAVPLAVAGNSLLIQPTDPAVVCLADGQGD
jgi:hypothetical protein